MLKSLFYNNPNKIELVASKEKQKEICFPAKIKANSDVKVGNGTPISIASNGPLA